MDVEDVPAAVKEIGRVMAPDGELVLSLVHPFRDRGDFAGKEPDAPFILRGSYFGRERFAGVEERGGLRMHFAGWSQPLEAYAAALEEAGLAITALREPRPDQSEARDYLKQGTCIPLFLWLKARLLTRCPERQEHPPLDTPRSLFYNIGQEILLEGRWLEGADNRSGTSGVLDP